MRAFLFPPQGHENNKLIKHAKKIFLAPKPAPATESSRFLNRQNYQLGSMSHYLNAKVNGYQELPDFPEVAPDPSLREVEPPKAPNPWEKTVEMNKAKKKAAAESKKKAQAKGFYSEDSDSGSGSGSESGSSSGSSSSGSESDSEDEDDPERPVQEVVKKDDNTLLLVTNDQPKANLTSAM